MAYEFLDKDGNTLTIDNGEPDPEKYAEMMKFAPGWTVQKIEKKQAWDKSAQMQIAKGFKRKVIISPEASMRLAWEVIEEHLNLPKGRIKKAIKDKMREKGHRDEIIEVAGEVIDDG